MNDLLPASAPLLLRVTPFPPFPLGALLLEPSAGGTQGKVSPAHLFSVPFVLEHQQLRV